MTDGTPCDLSFVMSLLAIKHLLASFDAPCGLPTTFITSNLPYSVYDQFGIRWYGWPSLRIYRCFLLCSSGWREKALRSLTEGQVPILLFYAALFGFCLVAGFGYVLFYRPEMLTDPSAYCESAMAEWQSRRHHWTNYFFVDLRPTT